MALTDNIVAYWKLDENTGSVVADSVASFGGTWQGALGSQWATGLINSGGNLNGADNYVSSGAKSLGLGTAITLSLWVNAKTLAAATYYCWFSFGGYIAGGWILQRAGDSGDVLRFAYNGDNYFNGPAFNTTGAFVHLAVTVSGTPTNFYINNVATGATRAAGAANFSATDPQALEIGRRGDNTQLINGTIDEIGLWNRTLSSGEIGSLYNSGAGLQYPFSTGNFGNMVSTLSFAGSLKTI